MTLASALYLLAVGAAALMALWAAGSAAIRNPDARPQHRMAVFVVGVCMPPLTAWVMLGPRLGHTEALWLWPLLPLLCVAVLWANGHSLRQHGMGMRIFMTPVLLWNACLLGIHSMRALWETTGLEPGPHGPALLHAYGILQNTVGQGMAEQHPNWLLLPFLLPMAHRIEWPHRLTFTGANTIALGLTGLLVLGMPIAFQQAERFRRQPVQPAPLPDDMALGVITAAGDRVVGDGLPGEWQHRLLQLGADVHALDVTPEILSREDLQAQVRAQLAASKAAGQRTMVFARPAPDAALVPLPDVARLAQSLAGLHWFVAEDLQPDVLVLFAGPFATLRHFRLDEGTVEGWHEEIHTAVEAVRRVNDGIQLAVSIESRAPHAEELFRRLAHSASPLDLAGLSVFAGANSRRHLSDDLDKIRGLVRGAGPSRPVWLLEAGVSPHCCGGELGQWHGLAEILAAGVDLEVAGIVIRNLSSVDEDLGLISPLGRPRDAWDGLLRWSTRGIEGPAALQDLAPPPSGAAPEPAPPKPQSPAPPPESAPAPGK